MSEWKTCHQPSWAPHSESGLETLGPQSGRAASRGRIPHFENCWCSNFTGISKLHREVIDHKMDLEIGERAKVSTDLETNPWKRLGTRARLRRGGEELEQAPPSGSTVNPDKLGPQTLSTPRRGQENLGILPLGILQLTVVASAEKTARSGPPTTQQVPSHWKERSSQAFLF